jgi:hypothetical protein
MSNRRRRRQAAHPNRKLGLLFLAFLDKPLAE